MADMSLTAAFGDYDRIHPLRCGDIRPEGIDLRVLNLTPGEINYRMSRHLEFDISELSMAGHCYFLGRGGSPFVGIPAFPSRVFRHSNIYLNEYSGIEKPEDLNGKRIALREWGNTAALWTIGVLAEEHGFDFRSVEWVFSSDARMTIPVPPGLKFRSIAEGQERLSEMLDSGDVDAGFFNQAPRCFVKGSPHVRRLFPNYKAVEIDYYRRTGIHPIMHCVVVRRALGERAPWVLQNIYKALCQARERALSALRVTTALSAMIPLLPAVLEETREVFGDNFWPYGVDANTRTLERLVLYAHQQGLTPRRLTIEELFAESVLSTTFF